MKRVGFLVLAGISVLMMASVALSADAAKGAKAMKGRYLVIAPHTAEQCMAVLDEVNAMGAKTLAAWDFGCMAGDHTGYMTVTASSEDEVKAMIPASGRESAKIVKLGKFTPADLKAIHEKMEHK